MKAALDDYVNRFSKLNTDRARWRGFKVTRERAPHKALLLMSVIDQFEFGALSTNLVELTPDLVEAFHSYWSRVMPRTRRGVIALPFFYLQSEGFWHLAPKPGMRSKLEAKRSIRHMWELQDLVAGAQLDDVLFQLLCRPEPRSLLRNRLLNTYFADEAQLLLLDQAKTNSEVFKYSQQLLFGAEHSDEVCDSDPVRSQGFRRAVVTAYEHRCAMSGIRIQTPQGHTVVNASHIVPWSVSHNDDPSNGLALSPLCHWAFDEGLITVSKKYRIVLSRHLRRDENIAGDLLALEHREIILPENPLYWPSLESLEYHRDRIFCP